MDEQAEITPQEMMVQTLQRIQELCKPGQHVNTTDAVDIIYEAWRAASDVLEIVRPAA